MTQTVSKSTFNICSINCFIKLFMTKQLFMEKYFTLIFNVFCFLSYDKMMLVGDPKVLLYYRELTGTFTHV